ncbi:MAG: alpha/beta hydrolase [Flavihumibacter sp.]|nr:alpha/beta hydrolase [Flavihumibacter sp.]
MMAVQKRSAGVRTLRLLLRTFLIVFIFLNIIAAFHAWKFTHFYDGAATVRLKPEQMSGWQKTKAALFGITYYKSENKEQPALPFKTIPLKTAGGLTLQSWYINKDSSKGTVIMFHGHGSSKSKILREAYAMHAMGYAVLLTDFRAHGGSGGNACTIGYDEANDVKAAYDYIQQQGEKNIVLWGISLGAATTARAISVFKLQPSKLIMEMSFGSLEQAVKGRVRIMGLPEQPIATLLSFWGGTEHGFWAFNHNPQDYVKDIQCPLLVQWGRLDARVTEAETQTIFANAASTAKKLVVYETAKHESLLDKEPEKWKNEVGAFLSQQ